jgi:phytanoyl-CoA hydroxylase
MSNPASATSHPALTPAQLEAWQRDGYLHLPGFKSAADCQALKERAIQWAEGFDAARHRAVFSTQEQSRTADAYFLASAENVSCFLEEEALDADGQLRTDLPGGKINAINKIGHALHDLDGVFEAFSHGPQLAALAQALGQAQPQVWQSMVIVKPPQIGGEVRWHQDASFLASQPQSVIAYWFALDEATRDNGCMWVQPGGHRGPLREVFEHTCADAAPAMRTLDSTPWPTLAEAVPLEAGVGDLVVMHGLLPHFSAPNRSALPRMAYTLHATCASTTYSPHNWLKRRQLPVRGF